MKSATYIALIRGINVANTQISMERLRKLCAACGFEDVQTYIQSGNVVFSSGENAASCSKALAARLQRELGKPIAVLVRSARDLARIVTKNPFLKGKGVETARVHVAFLAEKPKADRLKALEAVDWGHDRFHYSGKDLYLHCPDGFGRSKLATTFERMLGVGATVRNWNTVSKLLEMAT
ncbi:MAG TPA: DUF1697 domain-containing protein [Candidatus Eremiobacteraceae bacterium]|nr:DUF1697 domain-containing protein [Candidatus Eremiobacteraceae bacterium]